SRLRELQPLSSGGRLHWNHLFLSLLVAGGRVQQAVKDMTKSRVVLCVTLALLPAGLAIARDDGRYANSPLKPWFDGLRSSRGLCCSDADGFAVSDPDWDS